MCVLRAVWSAWRAHGGRAICPRHGPGPRSGPRQSLLAITQKLSRARYPMYGPGPALVSSGAGALHSKCPRGPRGSPGAGEFESWPSPSPIADEPRAASRRGGAQFCLLPFLCALARRAHGGRAICPRHGPGPRSGPRQSLLASHNPEAEPRALPHVRAGSRACQKNGSKTKGRLSQEVHSQIN